jgi:hypothetical protein
VTTLVVPLVTPVEPNFRVQLAAVAVPPLSLTTCLTSLSFDVQVTVFVTVIELDEPATREGLVYDVEAMLTSSAVSLNAVTLRESTVQYSPGTVTFVSPTVTVPIGICVLTPHDVAVPATSAVYPVGNWLRGSAVPFTTHCLLTVTVAFGCGAWL